ncbi:uridine permease Fui1 [Rhizoctonia solani AG-1 IA]|uniref:Uridine permease Fui1 n=1 Tax=Thanatephorus cucumeris (strain AG1-IA) TaxID=983506 RepID=L8XB71_THACA|nr:uridine permease Fui1 [Rhizoctonia solani AG-1 IA]
MTLKQRSSSLLKRLEVEHEPDLTNTQLFLSNEDLQPVPPERRTWKAWNFYDHGWTTDSILQINTWMIVSSMITDGLSWWQAWVCVWLGYGIVAPFIVLNARPGAIQHITFPVVARTSFGLWGSLWCTFNRGAMACIWYGVQASIGGSCVLVMLRSMWPTNSMPESSGTNTRDFMCFFLFWLISLPAIWFPIHKMCAEFRHLFTAKAIVVPIAGIAFFVWSIVKAKGVGPIIHRPAKLHGSELGWVMVKSLMSCISNMATAHWSSNAPDFASRAHRPSNAVMPQLISVPLGFSLVSFLGIIVSSSSEVIYGEPVWSPVDLLGKLLDGNPSHATRFGVWFISTSFILAQVCPSSCSSGTLALLTIYNSPWQLGTNISANSVSAGCDLTALFPRFINIRRGGYIAAIVGLAMCPWQLLKDSNSFTSYLSELSEQPIIPRLLNIGLSAADTTASPISTIPTYGTSAAMCTRGGHPPITTFYFPIVAYISGILINVVGFAGASEYCYDVEPFLLLQRASIKWHSSLFASGFGVSSIIYYVLNRIWPSPGSWQTFEEVDESGWHPVEEHRRDSEEEDSYSVKKQGDDAFVREVPVA